MTRNNAIVQSAIAAVSTSTPISARMLICRYHADAMSIWQYSGHIVTEAATNENRSGLAWHDCHGIPEVSGTVGASGGPGTASPNDRHCQGGTILDVMQFRTGALVKTANAQYLNWSVRQHGHSNSQQHVSRYTLTNWHDEAAQTCMSGSPKELQLGFGT